MIAPNIIYVCGLAILYLYTLVFLPEDVRAPTLLFGGPIVYLFQVALILQPSFSHRDPRIILTAILSAGSRSRRLLFEYVVSLSIAIPLASYLQRAHNWATIYAPLAILAACKLTCGDIRLSGRRDRLLFAILQGYFVTYGYYVFVLCATSAAGLTLVSWDLLSLTRATWIFIDFAKSILLIGSFTIILPRLANEIRSIDKCPLSWLFTLICYPPLFDFFEENFFDLDRKYVWNEVLAQQFAAQFVYGLLILLLAAMYASDLFSWQCDFSQLCYRKLVASGPFRLLRHPAYVFKCLFFWVAAFPFLAPTSKEIIRQTMQLLVISLIYLLRATMEDIHLGKQPDYRKHFFQRHAKLSFGWPCNARCDDR